MSFKIRIIKRHFCLQLASHLSWSSQDRVHWNVSLVVQLWTSIQVYRLITGMEEIFMIYQRYWFSKFKRHLKGGFERTIQYPQRERETDRGGSTNKTHLLAIKSAFGYTFASNLPFKRNKYQVTLPKSSAIYEVCIWKSAKSKTWLIFVFRIRAQTWESLPNDLSPKMKQWTISCSIFLIHGVMFGTKRMKPRRLTCLDFVLCKTHQKTAKR